MTNMPPEFLIDQDLLALHIHYIDIKWIIEKNQKRSIDKWDTDTIKWGLSMHNLPKNFEQEKQNFMSFYYDSHKIPDKFKNKILDKNKDDFLCQYFFYILHKTNNCILISNDKYRDKKDYVKLFNFDIFIKVVNYNRKSDTLDKTILKIHITDTISNDILLQKYTRCTIPKRDLDNIL